MAPAPIAANRAPKPSAWSPRCWLAITGSSAHIATAGATKMITRSRMRRTMGSCQT